MQDEPLFLEIGFPGPHPPYDPIESYTLPYRERELPLLEATAEEIAAQPSTLDALRARLAERFADSIAFDPLAPAAQRQRQRAYYLANVSMIDEQVGRIMARLRERGFLDDAVVIFTSDHGDCLGDHGLVEKWNMYDSSVRVPLVVSRAGAVRRRPARGRPDPVVRHRPDGAGAGRPAAAAADGSAVAAAAPGGRGGRAGAPLRLLRARPDMMLRHVDHLLMIRDRRHKLVQYLGTGEGQLFDLQRDPDELHDLWDSLSRPPRRSRRAARPPAALVRHQHDGRRRVVEIPRGAGRVVVAAGVALWRGPGRRVVQAALAAHGLSRPEKRGLPDLARAGACRKRCTRTCSPRRSAALIDRARAALLP